MKNSISSVERSNDAEQKAAALACELDNLRPECERLKSQLASHQAVVASNGDLRRQINTLEVELENEKRSKLRAHQAEENLTISDLRSKLQQIEGKLDAEKRDKTGLHKELAESRGQQKLDKERLSALKSKLKETEGTLKVAQADLEESRHKLAASKQKSTKVAELPQKKLTKSMPALAIIEPSIVEAEMSVDDVNIQTPGDETSSGARQPRRRGPDHALLGEKSTFSITPFLNKGRDASQYPDLDSDSSVSNAEVAEMARVERGRVSPESPPARAKRTAGRQPPTKLNAKKTSQGDVQTQSVKAKLGESNANPKSTGRKRPRLGAASDTGLTNDKKNSDSDFALQEPETDHNLPVPEEAPPSKAQEPDVPKRKRKMLIGKAKTMFDDDEMEDANPLRLGPVKRSRAHLAGVSNAFATSGKTFSPLKRERRGVNASFLG